MLNQSILKKLISYNAETGEFTRLIGSGKGAALGTKTKGSLDKTNGYLKLCIKGKQYYSHRLAWLYMTGHWPPEQIDHKNEIRTDNRFDNLRLANNAQNNQRSKPRSDSDTQILGVCWNKKAKKYIAQITHNKRHYYLGVYDYLHDAILARRNAENSLHDYHRSSL